MLTMSTLSSAPLRSGCRLFRTNKLQSTWTPLCLSGRPLSQGGNSQSRRSINTISAVTAPSAASTPDQHSNSSSSSSSSSAAIPSECSSTEAEPLVVDNTSTLSVQDAFKHPTTLQEAKKRWGLLVNPINTTTTTSSPGGTPKVNGGGVIVYPEGRPEIVELTRKMMENRILGGYTGQRQLQAKKQQHINNGDIYDTPTTTMTKTGTTASQSPNPHLHRAPRDANSSTAMEIPLWRKHREAIKAKTGGQAWNPQRKLTRQAMEEVRYLRKQFPEEWTTAKLAEHFNVAGESIAKILRTHYQPTPERAAQQDEVRQRHRKENITADVERIRAERQATWTARKAEQEAAWRQQKAERRAAQFAQKIEREGSGQRDSKGTTLTLEEYEQIKNDRHSAWLARQAERKRKNAESPSLSQIKLGAPTRK